MTKHLHLAAITKPPGKAIDWDKGIANIPLSYFYCDFIHLIDAMKHLFQSDKARNEG
jgi:hypothetical protein